MNKACVYAKSGRSRDDEKRALELWMTSLQTPVKGVSKERVFELAKAFATDELAWTMGFDSFSTGIITSAAEGPNKDYYQCRAEGDRHLPEEAVHHPAAACRHEARICSATASCA